MSGKDFCFVLLGLWIVLPIFSQKIGVRGRVEEEVKDQMVQRVWEQYGDFLDRLGIMSYEEYRDNFVVTDSLRLAEDVIVYVWCDDPCLIVGVRRDSMWCMEFAEDPLFRVQQVIALLRWLLQEWKPTSEQAIKSVLAFCLLQHRFGKVVDRYLLLENPIVLDGDLVREHSGWYYFGDRLAEELIELRVRRQGKLKWAIELTGRWWWITKKVFP